MPTNRVLTLLLIALTCLISACGFELRGYSDNALSPRFKALKLTCENKSQWQLCQSLRQQFAINSIELLDDAEYELIISPLSQERRVVSIQNNASAAEYGLSSSVEYRLIHHPSNSTIAEQKIILRNSYRHESSALLAKDREQKDLEDMLSHQMANQIFNEISVSNMQAEDSYQEKSQSAE